MFIIHFRYSSYANSAFCIEDENSDEFEANSDELSDEDDELPQPTTRVKQIDKSPEFFQKRKEVYNKWLQSVK